VTGDAIGLSGTERYSQMELAVTWQRVLRVWWALAWRSFLAIPLGGALGCVVGFVMGFLGPLMHVDQGHVMFAIQLVTIPMGLAIGLLVGLWATRAVLRKSFSEFRIALIAR
jgi:hypothetical protein